MPRGDSYFNIILLLDGGRTSKIQPVGTSTVGYCFWIARLVMGHGITVSELQTVCSVHVADDPFGIV